MRLSRTTLKAVCVMLLVMLTPAMAMAYVGSLSSSNGGLTGVGAWAGELGNSQGPAGDRQNPGSQIFWEITPNFSPTRTVWHYEYVLVVPINSPEISHFILEISPTFTERDLLNPSGAFSRVEIKDHVARSPGSPELPPNVFGIKFDDTFGRLLSISFDSFRDPVWGDFYARSGDRDSQQIWNTGLTYVDPVAGPSNGSINNHILVPDSVPEPASLLVLSIGALIVRGKFRGPKKTA